MKSKRLHTTGKDTTDQQDVCGQCFSWVEYQDKFCWSCGAEFEDESAYNFDDIKEFLTNTK